MKITTAQRPGESIHRLYCMLLCFKSLYCMLLGFKRFKVIVDIETCFYNFFDIFDLALFCRGLERKKHEVGDDINPKTYTVIWYVRGGGGVLQLPCFH